MKGGKEKRGNRKKRLAVQTIQTERESWRHFLLFASSSKVKMFSAQRMRFSPLTGCSGTTLGTNLKRIWRGLDYIASFLLNLTHVQVSNLIFPTTDLNQSPVAFNLVPCLCWTCKVIFKWDRKAARYSNFPLILKLFLELIFFNITIYRAQIYCIFKLSDTDYQLTYTDYWPIYLCISIKLFTTKQNLDTARDQNPLYDSAVAIPLRIRSPMRLANIMFYRERNFTLTNSLSVIWSILFTVIVKQYKNLKLL